MAQTNPFVCKVVHSKDEPISVVFFSDQQIHDIKRFCVHGRTVLCIDKTYNLAKAFVTSLCIKI